MPDLVGVGTKLVQVIAQALYPNGTGSPSKVGLPVAVYQGWPAAQQLGTDLASGKVHVSIFARPTDVQTAIAMGDEGWEERGNNGSTGQGVRVLRRQKQTYQITVWASCFEKREPVAAAVDAALAALPRITFDDTSVGTIRYAGSVQNDEAQKQGIYRRDLFYSVDYSMVETVPLYAIKHVQTNVTAGLSDESQGFAFTFTTPPEPTP